MDNSSTNSAAIKGSTSRRAREKVETKRSMKNLALSWEKEKAPGQVVGRVSMIESVDSERLLDKIDAESAKAGVVTRVLMQLHVAAEETKSGFTPEELLDYFRGRRFESLKATHICGVMGMATNTDDEKRIAEDFESIARVFDTIRTEIAPDLRGFDTVSMGMSHDYPLAVSCGSTMVRVGTGIFGEREY